jgi:hypothetical protein
VEEEPDVVALLAKVIEECGESGGVFDGTDCLLDEVVEEPSIPISDDC